MELARVTGISYERVAELGCSIDGGSGEFNTWRHDRSYEAALEACRAGGQPRGGGESREARDD
jgi:hypothetical protein